MIPSSQRFVSFAAGLVALALAGCAGTGAPWQAGLGGAPPRPKTVVVSDFLISSDVVVLDRGFTARLEHKTGSVPTFERKPRTVERVNDEIVASLAATLREAGLEARPGSEDTLTLSDDALVVSGRLRPGEAGSGGKNKQSGFGVGLGGVVADMTLSSFSSGGKQQLLTFSADAKGTGKPPAGKEAAARNAAIATVLTAEEAAPERLSPDVEGQARRIGRAAGDRIVAYAKEKGWLAEAGDEATVKLPKPKPAPKARKKPATADKPAA